MCLLCLLFWFKFFKKDPPMSESSIFCIQIWFCTYIFALLLCFGFLRINCNSLTYILWPSPSSCLVHSPAQNFPSNSAVTLYVNFTLISKAERICDSQRSHNINGDPGRCVPTLPTTILFHRNGYGYDARNRYANNEISKS